MPEMIEHRVVIDDNTTVLLKIPEELDAISLKGLMDKTNKLFKLSEVRVSPGKPRITKRVGGRNKGLSESEEKELLEDIEKCPRGSRQMVADKWGYTKSTIATMVKTLRKKYKIAKLGRKAGTGVFEPHKIDIIRMANKGLMRREVARGIGLDANDKILLKRLSDYMYRLKVEGIIKRRG